MKYLHTAGPTLLDAVWDELDSKGKHKLWQTLDYAFHMTACLLWLASMLIAHGISNMVKDISFVAWDYNFLIASLSTLFSDTCTEVSAEKLREKVSLWDKSICGNSHPSVLESMCMVF